MKRYLIPLISIPVLMVCCTKTGKEQDSALASMAGTYVSENYGKPPEGNARISVEVKALTDSIAAVAVFPAGDDMHEPVCRFEANALIMGHDTLKATHEGKGILFVFREDTLLISAEKKDDENMLRYFCSGGAGLAGKYVRSREPLRKGGAGASAFIRTLSFNNVIFEVIAWDNTLSIRPAGLELSNEEVAHDILGYSVVRAETGDLNRDGYPELMVYLASHGSGSYGKVIGYSVNNGKSLSRICYDPEADSDKVEGYMGHDRFAMAGEMFVREFPLYKKGDSNARPTGGTYRISYRLTDGEACRKLVVADEAAIPDTVSTALR